MKRVGFIVECQKDGPDHKVIGHVARRLRVDVEPVFRFLGSKSRLLPECGEIAAGLFEIQRCEHVSSCGITPRR
jgi:hypothetical protein